MVRRIWLRLSYQRRVPLVIDWNCHYMDYWRRRQHQLSNQERPHQQPILAVPQQRPMLHNSIRKYAINIKKNTNADIIFTNNQQGMMANAKQKKAIHKLDQRIRRTMCCILIKRKEGKDELIHNMCTQTVFVERTLTTDQIFSHILAGEKGETKSLGDGGLLRACDKTTRTN